MVKLTRGRPFEIHQFTSPYISNGSLNCRKFRKAFFTGNILQNSKQTRCSRGCSTNSFVINKGKWWCVDIYSKHCQSQTGQARELKFWENVHPTLCVMFYVSRVTRHLSPVTCHRSFVPCHLSHVVFFNIFFIKKKERGNISSLKKWTKWLS